MGLHLTLPPRGQPGFQTRWHHRFATLLLCSSLLTCQQDNEHPNPTAVGSVWIAPGLDIVLPVADRTTRSVEFQLNVCQDADGKECRALTELEVSWSNADPVVGQFVGSTFFVQKKDRGPAPNKPALDFTSVTASFQSAMHQPWTVNANVTVLRPPDQPNFLDRYVRLRLGEETIKEVAFTTRLKKFDAYLAIDGTRSMAYPVAQIAAAYKTLMESSNASALQLRLGIGAVGDYDTLPYGQPGCYTARDSQGRERRYDVPFDPIAALTQNTEEFGTGLFELAKGWGDGSNSRKNCGGDAPNAQAQALYRIATEATKPSLGFAADSIKAIALVTSSAFHRLAGDPAHSTCKENLEYTDSEVLKLGPQPRTQVMDALKTTGIKMVGISIVPDGKMTADPCLAREDLREFAEKTGAVVPPGAWGAGGARPTGCTNGQCCTGLDEAGEPANAEGLCPLVFTVRAESYTAPPTKPDQPAPAVARIIKGLSLLASYGRLTVGVPTAEDPGQDDELGKLPTGHNSTEFVKRTGSLKEGGKPPPTCLPSDCPVPTSTPSEDGYRDVVPGSTLRFKLHLANTFVPSGPLPQLFRIRLTLQTTSVPSTELGQQDIYVLVPATAPLPLRFMPPIVL